MIGIKINQYSDCNFPLHKRKNLMLSIDLVHEAQALGINLSKAAEQGIYQAIKLRKQCKNERQ